MAESFAIELVGGPSDGRLFAVPVGPDGLPPVAWELPVSPDPVKLWETTDPSVVPEHRTVMYYRADAMSDRDHVWRYHFQGGGPRRG